MSVALVVIGVLAVLAAVPVGVVAVVQRVRSHRAKPAARATAALAAGGLVLLIIGGSIAAASPQATTTADPSATPSPVPSTATPTATATEAAMVSLSASAAPTTAAATPVPAATTAAPAVTAAPAPVATPTPKPTPTPTRTRDVAVAAGSGPAAAALLALPVKGRAAKTGYSRDAFGPAWADVDSNGCDTRDDVLRRDLTATTITPGSGGCEIATGTLTDPYSGTTIPFTRGVDTSSDVQVDHVVALSNAWQTGAFAWTPDTREQFANDPLNLLAVQGRLNSQKGDGDSATWLPPATGIRCAYVARQVAVKTKYHLWATAPEQAATARLLTGCPSQTLPTEQTSAVPAPDPAADPAPPPAATVTTAPTHRATPRPTVEPTSPAPEPDQSAGLDPRFGTCKAAIAAGYGPYTKGVDPEYDWYQDRDDDGIDCEHR